MDRQTPELPDRYLTLSVVNTANVISLPSSSSSSLSSSIFFSFFLVFFFSLSTFSEFAAEVIVGLHESLHLPHHEQNI